MQFHDYLLLILEGVSFGVTPSFGLWSVVLRMSIESKERISPMMAVEGVGNVLLDSGDESSITSTSVPVRFRELTFEAKDSESAVVDGEMTFFEALDEVEPLGRNNFVTDSEAVTKTIRKFRLNASSCILKL